MTLDELLLEWSYRSDRGYPSTDNPSDVLLLKDILRELKLPEGEIDDIVDDLEGDEAGGDDLTVTGTDGLEYSPVEKEKEEKEKQAQQQISKDEEDEINNHIDSISCPIDQGIAKLIATDPNLSISQKIKKINRNCNFASYNPIKDTLELKGYKEFTKKGKPAELKAFSNELQNIIEDVDIKDREDFLNYLKDENLQVDFIPEKGKPGNLYDDAKKTGLADSIITKLVRHTTQDSGKKSVGMGELALSLLFKNVGAAVGKGDLSLDGKEFEIKGEGATLGARPDTVNVISLDNIAKFVQYESEEEEGLYMRSEKKKNKDGVIKTVTSIIFKGKKWVKNNFSEILADVYRDADDKDAFKKAFKQDLKDIDKVEKNMMTPAVDQYFDLIKWEKGELEIQRGIALINAYRYMLVEGFQRFLAHDFGSTGNDTGEYIYAEGDPLQIVNQLLEAGARFEKISPANMKPRIGFHKGYREEVSR
jgi:hypothetical protein